MARTRRPNLTLEEKLEKVNAEIAATEEKLKELKTQKKQFEKELKEKKTSEILALLDEKQVSLDDLKELLKQFEESQKWLSFFCIPVYMFWVVYYLLLVYNGNYNTNDRRCSNERTDGERYSI